MHHFPLTRRLRLSLLAATLALGFCAGSRADVIANFTGGTGTASADQYAGTSGSGWNAGWNSTRVGPGTVVNTSPLSGGGGNYLHIDHSVGAVSGNFDVSRAWQNAAVSYTQPLTLSWQVRYDGDSDGNDSTFTSTSDQLVFADGSVGTGSTFFIAVFGANSGSAVAKNWAFYNGLNNTTLDTSRYVDSGITLTVGTVYTFNATMSPTTATWVGSVSDGTNSFTSGTLNFRSAATSAAGTFSFRSAQSNSADGMQVSLDSISIAAIPEPTALSLLGVGVLAITIGKRRPKGTKI